MAQRPEMTAPDPIADVRDALLLLQTGRAAMALRLLEASPSGCPGGSYMVANRPEQDGDPHDRPVA